VAAAVALVCACVSNGQYRLTPTEMLAEVAHRRDFATALVGKDAAAIRALLHEGVVDTGLWFADADCERRFAAPRMVPTGELDAFAGCIAGLHVEASDRVHSVESVAMLAYGPGLELQAWLLVGSQRTQLLSIGYAGDDDGRNDVAVTPRAMEALRIAGSLELSDPATRAALDADLHDALPGAALGAQLKVCVDPAGKVKRIDPQWASSRAIRAAYVELIKGWQFKPFELGGGPVPVCTLELLSYPADPAIPLVGGLVPPWPDRSTVGVPLGHRISGETQIQPDREVSRVLRRGGALVGAFQLCVDETGRVTLVHVYDSTGVASYDADLIEAMHTWRYKPAVVDGHAAAACGIVAFTLQM
jgi:hypothetical protein